MWLPNMILYHIYKICFMWLAKYFFYIFLINIYYQVILSLKIQTTEEYIDPVISCLYSTYFS